MTTQAIAIARADKRNIQQQRIMSMDKSFAFRLAALNAMGGERRTM